MTNTNLDGDLLPICILWTSSSPLTSYNANATALPPHPISYASDCGLVS